MTRTEAIKAVLAGKVVRPVGDEGMEFWYDETQIMPFVYKGEDGSEEWEIIGVKK